MGQISPVLRRMTNGYAHWCPGCGEMHAITTERLHGPGPIWSFDGNIEVPTFNPSVRITGKQTVKDAQGEWTGEWVCGPDGKALDYCCHYFLHAGQIKFCGDSTHALADKTVSLQPLPDWLKDVTFR